MLVTPKDVNLRKFNFKTMQCKFCRYYPATGAPKTGFCKVLDQDVNATQACDAYQGAEKKFPKYTLKEKDQLDFINGMVKTQPYQHIVVKAIETPIGNLVIIKDTIKPKPHFFSLDMTFHVGHTSREHGWSQEDVNKIIKSVRKRKISLNLYQIGGSHHTNY